MYEESSFNVGNGTGWDGTYNGNMVKQGIYAYYFSAIFPEGDEEIFTGTITLTR